MADQSVQRSQGSGASFYVQRPADAANSQGEIDTDSAEGGSVNVGGFYVTERPDQSPQGTETSISVEQPLPRGARRCSVCGQTGHTARNCPADGSSDVGTRAARRPGKDALNLVAPTILGTLNFMVVSSYGAECGLTDFEAKVMTPSLQRSLERLPKEAAEKGAIIIDPLVLITCAFFWFRRIGKIQDNKAKERYAVKPAEQARADGVSGTTFSVQSPASYQQTNGHVATPPVASPADAPAAYGVPDSIRESFANDNF